MSKPRDVKAELLDKIIKVFESAKVCNRLEGYKGQTRRVLTTKLGLSNEVADQYIDAALERV